LQHHDAQDEQHTRTIIHLIVFRISARASSEQNIVRSDINHGTYFPAFEVQRHSAEPIGDSFSLGIFSFLLQLELQLKKKTDSDLEFGLYCEPVTVTILFKKGLQTSHPRFLVHVGCPIPNFKRVSKVAPKRIPSCCNCNFFSGATQGSSLFFRRNLCVGLFPYTDLYSSAAGVVLAKSQLPIGRVTA
jgi:hypothetical protein